MDIVITFKTTHPPLLIFSSVAFFNKRIKFLFHFICFIFVLFDFLLLNFYLISKTTHLSSFLQCCIFQSLLLLLPPLRRIVSPLRWKSIVQNSDLKNVKFRFEECNHDWGEGCGQTTPWENQARPQRSQKLEKGWVGARLQRSQKLESRRALSPEKIGLIRICLLNVLGQKRCSLFQAFIFNKKPET